MAGTMIKRAARPRRGFRFPPSAMNLAMGGRAPLPACPELNHVFRCEDGDRSPIPAGAAARRAIWRKFMIAAARCISVGAVSTYSDPHRSLNIDLVFVATVRATHVKKKLLILAGGGFMPYARACARMAG
jgi:hypothetical protein